VNCPGCKTDDCAVFQVEHLYPKVYLNMPAFWKWVSKKLAVVIISITILFSIGILSLACIRLTKGFWFIGALLILTAVFLISIIVPCIKALKQHRQKEFFRCHHCGLEWSWSGENNVR